MKDPIWIQTNVVLALARPRQLLTYDQPDLAALAAAYVVSIIRNHPFVNGNKRTSFMTGYVFLARNNRQLTASEFEATRCVSAVASGEMQEEAFADWLRNNTESR